jgi:uncharacterized protein YrrD
MKELRPGEGIRGSDGQRLGEIERLVVDEGAHRVTHVVVNGHLVGVGRLRPLGDDGLAADLTRDQLRLQPEVHDEVVHAPGPHWLAPGGYSLGDFLRIATALVGQTAYVPPVHLDVDLSAVHEIEEGSPVWSGRRQLGHVSGVLTEDDGALSALVVHLGGLRGPRRVLPVGHVTEVVGTNVYVDLSEQELEALPEAD